MSSGWLRRSARGGFGLAVASLAADELYHPEKRAIVTVLCDYGTNAGGRIAVSTRCLEPPAIAGRRERRHAERRDERSPGAVARRLDGS
jgi:hypothetical protein